jgi:hypothetical protein
MFPRGGVLYEGNSGFIPAPGGVAIVGTTAIPLILQGPLFANTSFTLFATGTVAGAWKIEACNDYLIGGEGGNPSAGSWVDITLAWRTPNATTGTAIAAVTSGGNSQYVEYMGNPGIGLGAKSLRVTFTPTSGAGNIGIAVNSNAT